MFGTAEARDLTSAAGQPLFDAGEIQQVCAVPERGDTKVELAHDYVRVAEGALRGAARPEIVEYPVGVPRDLLRRRPGLRSRFCFLLRSKAGAGGTDGPVVIVS